IHEAQGKLTKLRCRYHGWTYDLTGALRGTPEFDGVDHFCKEDNGLVALAAEEWGPLVFVHAPTPLLTVERGRGEGIPHALNPIPIGERGRGEGIPQLKDFLAPLPERTAGMGLEKLWFVQRREYEIDCNWKVFVDNYLDGGYHVNT